MAQKKRQYGSGCLLKTERGWVLRWREWEIAPDGARRRVLRYETLGTVSRKRATQVLALRLAAVASGTAPTRSRVTFRTLTSEWQTTVLPMYKHSTQKNHRHITEKHLLPHFGDTALSDITRQGVQAYVAHLTQAGYAPKSVDHIHDVLSAVLRTAVKWGHLQDNPARGVDMPPLRAVRPQWALTTGQGAALLQALPPLPRTMAGLAMLSGLRRGELFALRWADLDEQGRCLDVRHAVYEGTFGTPKTEAGRRRIPLADAAMTLIEEWKQHVKDTERGSLVFATRAGKPISPNNVMRRWIAPACEALQLPRATWLTFRRSYASWSHEHGVPGKVVAALMGHAKVDTTLNVYTQVLDGAQRSAVEKVGVELFRIVQNPERASELSY